MIKESFDRDGFVVLEKFLRREQVDRSLQLWDVLAADPAVSKFLDDENDPSTLKALHAIEPTQTTLNASDGRWYAIMFPSVGWPRYRSTLKESPNNRMHVTPLRFASWFHQAAAST